MQKMFIDGEFVVSLSGETFAVENPATEEIIDDVPRARAEDADRAVLAAVKAQDDWRFVPGIEKCELLHAAARNMRKHRERIATLLTQEGGKPLIENMDEVEWVAACFDYYAEVGRHESGRVIPPVQRHQMNFVMKEPYGLVVCIVPWNYPLLLMSWKVAPALAAGNAVIIKPSEHTPLSTLLLAEFAFQELPKGIVNVVTGYGPEVGEPLVAHRATQVIAFTGSVATGKRIAQLAAERVKKVNLELGGNDPFIICDDVDLDIAVRGAVWAAFLNMGQVCTSGERFYVFERVYDEFTKKFVDLAKKLRLGNPMGPDIDCGPLIREAHRRQIEARIEEAASRGGRVV